MRPSPRIESKAEVSDTWFTTRRFAALLGLLIVATFFPVVIGLETFAFGDSGTFANPVAFHHRVSFWNGELPSWNPLNSCGVPFIAQWNTMTLYPPSLIYLLLPFPWSFGVFRLAHLFLGGMGMYRLARRWSGSNLGAAIAGAIFAFNGLTWCGMAWPHLMAALAWMPWLVHAVENAWGTGRRAVIIAGLVGAMQMLSGGVEVIIQTWLLIATFWVVHFVRGKISRLQLAVKGTAIVFLIAGIAAVQLLPFLDFLRHSQRQSHFGISTMSAMPAMGWANYFVPLFRCAAGACGVFTQNGQEWVVSYYLGTGIVALAFLALLRVRERKVWLLMGIALFGLFMAMGGHGFLYDRIRRLVPFLGFMRFPVKFVVLVTFCLPLLAACGVNWLVHLPVQARAKEQRWIVWIGCICAGVMALIVWWSWHYPLAGSNAGMVTENAAVRAVFLGLILAGLAVLPQTKDAKLSVFSIALVLLFWLDVYTHVPNPSPTASASVMQPNTVRNYFHWTNSLHAGDSRVMLGKAAIWKMVSSAAPDPDTDALGRRLAQFLDVNLYDDLPKVDGFYSIDLNEHLDVFKRLYFTTNEATGLKDFLGVSQISSSTNATEWMARPGALPLITAGQRPLFVQNTQTLRVLFTEDFRPLDDVYLPPEAQGEVKATRARAKVLSSKFAAGRVQAKVQADALAMVVVAQNYYHPWHAYVDGVSTRLWRANYAFQAVEVPAGTHEISFVYEDTALVRGAILSLFTLTIALAIFAWKLPGRQNQNAVTELQAENLQSEQKFAKNDAARP